LIDRRDGFSGGVGDEVTSDALGKLLGPLGQDLPELPNVGERQPVRRLSPAIDRQPVLPMRAAFARLPGRDPVGDAMIPHHVEALEGEAVGVERGVTGGAGALAAVKRELLAKRLRPAGVGIDRVDVRGGRRDRCSQQPFREPDPALDG